VTISRDSLALEASDGDAAQAVRVRRAKDILLTWANTVSAMKIFPAEHDTVRNFIDSLAAKLEDFFELLPRMEVAVTEKAFLYEDRIVYTDETPSKSLPFFFFKDGTQALYFYRGLGRRELVEFLELVKTVSQRPAEENDIVAALWESDFTNIQYYAPDEFLENQILAERRASGTEAGPISPIPETLEARADRTKHAAGRVTLRPDDRQRLAQGFEGPLPETAQAGPPASSGPGGEVNPTGGDAAGGDSAGGPVEEPPAPSALSPTEQEEINALVRSNRLMWPEEEFVNLTAEIVYLEEDPAICAASLDILRDFFLDQLRAGQFPAASLVIDRLRELRGQIEREAPPKALLITEALEKLAGPRTLGAIDTALGSDLPVGWPAVLSFFRLLGPPVLPAAAGLFESLDDLDVRSEVLAFIRDCGNADPAVIARLASDVRPVLSRQIIGLLSELPDDRGVPFLARFVDFKSRDIKLEAIRTLAEHHNEKAGQILLAFLDDPEEIIRIQAALNLDHVGERARLVHMIGQASTKAFRRKSFKEKAAFLNFLGRTRSPEALEFLTALVLKASLWTSSRCLEMRLAAVSGLESMGTAEARAALEEGLGTRGKRVRLACRDALDRLSAGAGRSLEGRS
jgi:HEAT repeat protein